MRERLVAVSFVFFALLCGKYISPTGNSTQIDFPDWGWADLDRERLVWATGGKLFAGNIGPDGLTNETELHDFNQMTFERIQAPYDVDPKIKLTHYF